jgi:DNA-binding transcriptional regulator YiaG
MKEMYEYKGCGLPGIWLKNGFEFRDTKYGRAVAIHDLRGLHDVIAESIVEDSPALSGAEFRFLRKELDFSQSTMAALLGKSEQAIALWEKKDGVPKDADIIIRALYKNTKHGPVEFKELVDKVNAVDREIVERTLTLSDESGNWKACA